MTEPLIEEELHFLQRKQQIADELKRGRDLSPKGSLDAPILELIDFLNTLPNYYTTSSCSGRISIFQHLLSKSKGGQWLLIKHDSCEWKDFTQALEQIQTQRNEAQKNDAAGDVILRFEPFILAVECRSLAAASQLLSVAMACGFRESGLNAAQKRYILSVRSSVRLEVPIWSARSGQMLVGEDYLKYLLDLANQKYDKNLSKIARFDTGVRQEFGAAIPAPTTRPTKFYNPFTSSATHSNSSTKATKPKLSPHALLGRQERVLQNLEAFEQRLAEAEANVVRVRSGQPIVVRSKDVQKEKTKAAPADKLSSKSVLSSKSSNLLPPAAASTSSSSSSASATSLTSVFFVPRSQTKVVKDACTERRWIDVRFKITSVPLPTDLKHQLQQAGLGQALLDQPWMCIPLENSAVKQIEPIICSSSDLSAQRSGLLNLLGIGASSEVIHLYYTTMNLCNPTSTKSTSATSTSSASTAPVLSPTAPPRVRLMHFLRPLLLEAGVPLEELPKFESLLPHKWEKLGEDLLIFPSGSFKNSDWSRWMTPKKEGEIAPLWLAVMQAFKGITRIGLAHEVALADVLRTSQVELVVTGEEPTHLAHATITKRDSYQRLGWVLHKENSVWYNFDCTKVMFSSGNGSEKQRYIQMVQNENVAERFNDPQGETVVDLYAGIGYFTLPMLVHTAVAPTTTSTKSSTSSTVTPSATPHSKVHFLHACEWNPHSVESLQRNMTLNHIPTSRFSIHPGDNRRVDLIQKLSNTADRISLGLLPSSEDAYCNALKILKARGGILHVHANVPDHSHESFKKSLEETLTRFLSSDSELNSSKKSGWRIRAFRLTLVKNYAPRIGHVVVDVACFPPDSIWWTKQQEYEANHQTQPNHNKLDTKSTKSSPVVPTTSAPDSTNASSDPSLWYPYPYDVPIVHAPTFEQFRQIVADQQPVILRGVDIGPDWRQSFSPAGLLSLASRHPISNHATNPLVSVHVSPHSSRMDFLQRNYMFKPMKFKEMLERMMHIGRENGTNQTNDKSGTTRSPETPTLSSPTASSTTITRDSYFISPHELYYLRSLGSNPKTEVANFSQSWPELAKKLAMPRTPSTSNDGTYHELLDPAKVFSSIFRISSPGLQLWTHYDITDNLLIHLHGLKRVVLFPPQFAVGLGLKPEPDSSSSPILDIDARITDENRHLFPSDWPTAQSAGRQLILLPGDILFLPALWFHNVTSLKMKYVDGYEKVMRSSPIASSSASSIPSTLNPSLSSCGEIAVSLNLFWRELASDEYQVKDLYGNKDLVKGVSILESAHSIASNLATIPPIYRQFYGRRAESVLKQAIHDNNSPECRRF